MKKTLLLTFFTIFSIVLKAQLPDNSIAPNFTAVDINGNTHELYAYLDSGYTVILDLSATWCPPCWTVHESGLLQNIHDQYGPNGTNEMRVFYIESESANSVDQLHGIGTSGSGAAPATDTRGDWVGNNTYPFIDNASIASAYNLRAFPTLYAVTPERLTNVFVGSPAPSVQDFYAIHQNSFGPVTFQNDPLIMGYKGDDVATCQMFDAVVKVFNHGTNPLTSIGIELSQNGIKLGSKNWTGNLAPFGITDITIENVAVAYNDSIVAKIISANGGEDEDLSNNETNFQVNVLDEVNTRIVADMQDGTLDNLPSNVYYAKRDFDIYTISKNDLQTPPNYELGGFGNSTKSLMFDFYNNDRGEAAIVFDKLEIPSFVDSASLFFSYAYTSYSNNDNDKLNVEISTDCGTSWNSLFQKSGIQLQTAPMSQSRFLPNASQWKKVNINLDDYIGNTVIVKFTGTSAYGNALYLDDINLSNFPIVEDTIPEVVSINELVFAIELKLSPVPANNYINLNFSLFEATQVEMAIVSIEGSVLTTRVLKNAKDVSETFNVSSLSNGIYFMKINTNNTSSVRKFIVNK